MTSTSLKTTKIQVFFDDVTFSEDYFKHVCQNDDVLMSFNITKKAILRVENVVVICLKIDDKSKSDKLLFCNKKSIEKNSKKRHGNAEKIFSHFSWTKNLLILIKLNSGSDSTHFFCAENERIVYMILPLFLSSTFEDFFPVSLSIVIQVLCLLWTKSLFSPSVDDYQTQFFRHVKHFCLFKIITVHELSMNIKFQCWFGYLWYSSLHCFANHSITFCSLLPDFYLPIS